VSDKVREKYIHKGMSRRSYERAVGIAKESGARVLTYVFLKPIVLTEAQAIREAIKTIEYAFKTGSDVVALESAFVQQGTVMEDYFARGQFSPPKLWSVIEVAKRTKEMGPVLIGGFVDEPMPIAIPRNCDKCSQRIYRALDDYRTTLDLSVLDGIEDCECRRVWEKEIYINTVAG